MEYIRKLIREVFSEMEIDEAEKLKHAIDRQTERFDLILPKKQYEIFLANLSKIESHDFNPKISYAIKIMNCSPNEETPRENVIKGRKGFPVFKAKNSDGDQIWAVVRENKIQTIMFRGSHQTINPADNAKNLQVDKIVSNLNNL